MDKENLVYTYKGILFSLKKKAITSDKGLLSKIYKKLLRLNTKKTTTALKNGPKTLTDISPTKIDRWQINMKICSTSYVIREMQIKTSYHYTPIRKAKIQNPDNSKCL